MHDELDELRRSLNTHIYTLDIADLRAPEPRHVVHSVRTTSTDHNGYTIGNRYYVAHYKRGLVIFDSTTPTALTEIGSFDTYLSPSANSAGTDGAWGVYPFLPSGTLLVSDIENGLFLLKRNETLPPPGGGAGSAAAPPPRGGGGGGGSMDLVLLILLAWFAMLRGLQVLRKSNGLPARRFALQVDALQPRGSQRRAAARRSHSACGITSATSTSSRTAAPSRAAHSISASRTSTWLTTTARRRDPPRKTSAC